MTTRAGKPLNPPVTDSAPTPGDFPLGSPLSRAAARAMVERMEQCSKNLEVVVKFIDSEGKVIHPNPDGERLEKAGAMVIVVRFVKPDHMQDLL